MPSAPGPPTSHKAPVSFCLLPVLHRAPHRSPGLWTGQGHRAGAVTEQMPGPDPTEVGHDGAAPWVAQLRSAPRCPEGPCQGCPSCQPQLRAPSPGRGSGSDGPCSRGPRNAPLPRLWLFSCQAALPGCEWSRLWLRGAVPAPSALVLPARCSASNKRNYSLCTRLPPPLPAPISRGWEGAGASSALAQPIAPAVLRCPLRARGGSGWDLPSSPA